MANSPTGAASATYRKAVNEIADAIKTEPKHTRSPSDDFSDIIDEIPEALQSKALEWYRRGILRGMKKATDLMAEGTIYMEGEVVHAPAKIEVKTKIKFAGQSWENYSTKIKASDIGFE